MAWITLTELEGRCQKAGHRWHGNWMARRISRPLALRVTWVVLPLGLSAHAVTLFAWGVGAAAAAAFAWGSVSGWVVGALLWQLWYLLDHVDGQVARFRGTASLDGVALDYLMHHTLNLLLPLGMGWGLAARRVEPWWLIGGLVWGLATLTLGLLSDVRYKAFVQRLKLVRGKLEVVGGGGGRPGPASLPPRTLKRLIPWLARKICEGHVVLNTVTLLAGVQWLIGDRGLLTGGVYLATMCAVSTAVAATAVARSVCREAAEQEFAAWYRPAEGGRLVFEEGWWIVEEEGEPRARAEGSEALRTS